MVVYGDTKIQIRSNDENWRNLMEKTTLVTRYDNADCLKSGGRLFMAKRGKDFCSNVPHECQSAFGRRQKILTMTPSTFRFACERPSFQIAWIKENTAAEMISYLQSQKDMIIRRLRIIMLWETIQHAGMNLSFWK